MTHLSTGEDIAHQFFFEPSGNFLGGIGLTYNVSNLQSVNIYDHFHHQFPPGYIPQMTNFEMAMPVRPVATITPTDVKDPVTNPLGWNAAAFNSTGAIRYVVQPGDTLRTISQKLYADLNLSDMLALLNGLPSADYPIKAGHQLWAPQLVNNHNKSSNTRPYYEFLNVIIGNLSPRVKMPKPDNTDAMISMIIKMVAIALIIAASQGLAANMALGVAPLLGVSSNVAQGLIAGISASFMDAGLQGGMMLAGLQDKFSNLEMFEVGVSSAATPFIDGKIAPDFLSLPQDLQNTYLGAATSRALRTTMIQVGAQLSEMSVGARKTFDWRSLIQQIGSIYSRTAIEYGINSVQFNSENPGAPMPTAATKVFRYIANTAADTFLGSTVTHTPFSITNTAAQTFGNALAGELSEQLSNRLAKAAASPNLIETSVTTSATKKQTTTSYNTKAITNALLSQSPEEIFATNKPKNDFTYHANEVSLSPNDLSNQISDNNITETKSFLDLSLEFAKEDYDNAKITINDIKSHPIQSVINADLAILKNIFNYFFRPVKFAEDNIAPMIGTAKDFIDGDSDTRRKIAARTFVSTAENAALFFAGGAAARLAKTGFSAISAGRGVAGAENEKLISTINRVSSNSVNKSFSSEKALAEGWLPPYPADLTLREIKLSNETKFFRVHTDQNRPVGRFLVREKEIAQYLDNPEALRLHLGLPDVPIYITEVKVPSGATLLSGRIGPQPNFGLTTRSGFQYQLTSNIPESSFINTRPILKPNPYLNMSY